MSTRQIICFVFCQFLILTVPSQVLAQTFLSVNRTAPEGSIYYDVDVLANGNYVCVGLQETFLGGTSNSNEIAIAIYSSTGQLIRKIQSPGPIDQGQGVVATSDGGFATAGGRLYTGSPFIGDFLFTRYDANGNVLWSQAYAAPSGIPFYAYDIKQLSDGGFILTGMSFITGPPNHFDLYVLRTDAQGSKVWDYEYGGPNSERGQNIVLTQDGGYMITGRVDSTYGFVSKGFALKLDANGNNEWYKTFNSFSSAASVKAIQNHLGEYLMIKRPTSGMPSIMTLNAQGDSIGIKVYGDATSGARYYDGIVQNTDNSYCITGGKVVGMSRLWLLKLDENLDTVWSKTYGDSIPSTANRGNAILQTADKGYAIAGRWGAYESVLLKTDSLGNIINSVVTGVLVNDVNANCTTDVGEDLVPNNLVKITTSNGNHFYGYSNAQGRYLATVYDTGQATIAWINQNSYWQRPACQPAATTITLQPNDTSTVDLFAEPTLLCPKLTVSVSNFLLRRCFSNNGFYVTYCNEGTVPAANAYVEVTFDEFLEVDNSTLPWSTVNGNTYRFDLGTINVGACGSFNVNVTVDCDSTVLGQTHCVEAHIYPDSICEPVEPSWDLSSLFLQAQCIEGDSIRFTLTNQGTGDMAGPSSYSIVENLTVVNQVSFQLNAGESLTVTLPGNGSTYTMIVPQSIGHPGNSAPLRVVEGCGKNNQGNFEIGFTVQFPQDDQDEFVDILCRQNRGSYDPNKKDVEPLGIGNDGYVNATQPLAYTIHFQNTGTDTAFTVVLRDTLPASLDITTLSLTGASHNYTFQIIDSNILEWTFANIMLPDSNVNEPLSHGFVSFNINQSAGNVPGTLIKNRAGIYFDFNLPVITDYTLTTVVEDYKTTLATVSIEELGSRPSAVKLYPNPNTGQFYIALLKPIDGELSMAIFDLAGRQVSQTIFTGIGPHMVDIQNLETGMYFYTLTQGAENISNGKLLIQEN